MARRITPYLDAAAAEGLLADAAAGNHEAWLEYAHFPRHVDATTRACLAASGWSVRMPSSVEEGARGRAGAARVPPPPATADILLHGHAVASARLVGGGPRMRPYWTAEVGGRTVASGCPWGVVLEARGSLPERAADKDR